jgi:alanine-glyoxylate transaminase / serine-glyoxylate transaminase / serine-pyruvate transaminase
MTTTRIPGRRLLHAPGPTNLPDEVLDAMHRQSMDLADPRVMQCVDACEAGLRWLAGTADARVFLYATNGHGAWEVTIENLLPPGGLVLIPGTGHFSDQWAIQVEALGRRVLRTPWREGQPIDAAAVEQVLRADALDEIVAVFAVQTDTASGVTSDMNALRQAIDDSGHPALFVVDAVASLGAMPVAMDVQRFDVLVGASQKGLMLPPGVGFVLVNDKAMAVSAKNPAPRFYWDWTRRDGKYSYQKFCGTPPLQLLYGMQAAFKLLEQEGLENVYARHRELAGAVHAAVQGWSEGGVLSFFCQDAAARSVSVTAIAVTEALDPEALRRLARERFQVAVAGGLGPLTGRAFRIGHLGDLNAAMLLGAIAGVEATLLAMQVPAGPGARRAIEFLARE